MMESFYSVILLLHIISFVFMSVPLFNLIVVNERVLMGSRFVYTIDRYMENIIRRGAVRCYVFQTSALVTGLLLLILGPLGIQALWGNWVILMKTLLLFALMGLLSYVHFSLQPAIERRMAAINPESPPEEFAAQLKPTRSRRKQLATFCLFLVLTIIILGIQVYGPYPPFLTLGLIALAALFSWRASRTLVRFGWV